MQQSVGSHFVVSCRLAQYVVRDVGMDLLGELVKRVFHQPSKVTGSGAGASSGAPVPSPANPSTDVTMFRVLLRVVDMCIRVRA
jgi:hypothetical protein